MILFLVRKLFILLLGLGLASSWLVSGKEADTLAPIEEGVAAQDYEAMWDGFDPRAEPLEVELLHEWEEGGVVMQVVRFRIGIFKGQKAMMAGVYGYPKGVTRVPGLLNIHGGGQFADYRSVRANAQRGYATLSMAWAGRIAAPDYGVNAEGVQLFWEGKVDHPKYRLTTDWGALDAYHAPCRNPDNNFASTEAQPWTLDAVTSARNNPWFLVTLAARRALTFLEQQPQVDGERLGVYGHSMGGKLTVLTAAADERVKVAVPSCGGVSDRGANDELYQRTVADAVNLARVRCPILFLSPANDFHGRINDLPAAIADIQSEDWRLTIAPHHNHQDTGSYKIAGLLWMDQHLKDSFVFPQTPQTQLRLREGASGPAFEVTVDTSKKVLSVDVYYTQQGQVDGLEDRRSNTVNRFWHHAGAVKEGDVWQASLPVASVDKPLWVYANVEYALPREHAGSGYYYSVYRTKRLNVSSELTMVTADELKEAGVEAALQPSLVIEDFGKGWQKEWFTYQPHRWGRKTHKVYHPLWRAPAEQAQLVVKMRARRNNVWVLGVDEYAVSLRVNGGNQWQEFVLSASDLKNAVGEPLANWLDIKELRFDSAHRLRLKVKGKVHRKAFGAEWKGAAPEFAEIRWSHEP